MKHGSRELKPLGDRGPDNDRQVSPWPGGAPFALFLSHDIDQIYDRELFRFIGNVNHLRRMWFNGEAGSPILCLKRLARSILRPRVPGKDIETILSIESACGFRSTSFLLEDRVFNRLGGRYRYSDKETKAIAKCIERNNCEIAVHGAYHNYNNPAAYRAQAESFYDAFGRHPTGIRNHYLRHDGMATWKAQREAGFLYDASFGSNDQVGIHSGQAHPFFPFGREEIKKNCFVVLPMTIMDSALFCQMRLNKTRASVLCREIAEKARSIGGLFCLNWHNNYFDEEEYKHWQDIYESLLGWLVEQQPWNATGEEIADWWLRLAEKEAAAKNGAA